MLKIFVLASARSGTKYLAELFKYNINNCVAKHEPITDMFGKPIYWYTHGETKKIRRRFLLNKWFINIFYINFSNADVFIQTGHSFLKSYAEIAIEFFPDMKLIHLIRNPLEVAKSQYKRAIWIGDIDLDFNPHPLRIYYGDDGRKYCVWTLTGKEKIFQDIDLKLSRYQKFLTQWIEIENRAINFLEKYKKHDDCYVLHTPGDLNNEKKIREMFSFFGLETKKPEVAFRGIKNPSKIPTVITHQDKMELYELVEHIPSHYLKIFKDEPYDKFEWAEMLVK